jgi:phosphoglycerate dehydrogenase-like enzyme
MTPTGAGPEPTFVRDGEPLAVALLDDYQDVGRTLGPWSRLDGRVSLEAFVRPLARERLVATLARFDAIVAMRERTPFDRALVEGLPRLRLLVTTGMHNAALDLDALGERGVTVCGTEADGSTTVELTWALLLALARNVCEEDRSLRAGGWQHTLGAELRGRTLGLIGLGRLGRGMVPVARAFGMEVIAWSQNLTPAAARAAGAVRVEKDELLRSADFISLHYKLSPRSIGLLGARELALIKPTAFVINTSRGPLIDERALLGALHDGRIAGAALDVYDREPLPEGDPLRSAPRTVLTPHIGYVARGTYERWWPEIVEDVAGFLDGSPLRVIAAPG